MYADFFQPMVDPPIKKFRFCTLRKSLRKPVINPNYWLFVLRGKIQRMINEKSRPCALF